MGYSDELVAKNSIVVANAAKVGITPDHSAAITANALKVGITPEQAAAIEQNSGKVGYSDELVTSNSIVAGNAAKVGITPEQAAAIAQNSGKVGYSNELVTSNSIVAGNAAKVGITPEQATAITANALKVGITPEQATAISDNITQNTVQDGLIESNTAKTGISSDQASTITTNSIKMGITPEQATAISVNSAKVSFPGFGVTWGTALEGNTSIPSLAAYATENWVSSQGYGSAVDVSANSDAISGIDFTPFLCRDGYAGVGCVYSDAVTCSGHGAVADDGTCTCEEEWWTEDCSTPTSIVDIGEACTANNGCATGYCSAVSVCAPVDMTYVTAGDFISGPDGSTETLTIDDFYIDIYEVTAGDYKSCVDAGACAYAGATMGTKFSYNNTNKVNHPINYVNWQEAVDYCTWKDKRLPTEFEWEKAARSDDGRKYPWGNEAATCNHAVMSDGGSGCGSDSTFEVGKKPNGVSAYGAHDMAGNVWEWTSSWYGPINQRYVLRGGSADNTGVYLTSSYRRASYPVMTNSTFGFRCAQ